MGNVVGRVMGYDLSKVNKVDEILTIYTNEYGANYGTAVVEPVIVTLPKEQMFK